MSRLLPLVLTAAALVACGKKQDAPAAGPAGAAGSAGAAAVAPAGPGAPAQACPPGSLPDGGACVAVVTADKLAALKVQQSRVDELVALLGKVEIVAGPIELLGGLRADAAWKALVATSAKLKAVDDFAGVLDGAVKALRQFHDDVAANAGRLGNLQGELDALLTRPDAKQTLAEVRAKVSAEVRAVVEPLAAQLQGALDGALTPLTSQLGDVADLIAGACAMAKLSGGGDQLKVICAKQREVFGAALTYVGDLKDRPAALVLGVTKELLSQVPELLDAAAKQAVADTQTQVNALLRLPPAGAGAGPGSGSGAGSAK